MDSHRLDPVLRTYSGRKAVEEQLRTPFVSRLATPLRLVARRILTDGDHVIVECRGQAQTTSGGTYDNSYCMILRFSNGLIRELTEYMDTAHVLAVFAPPVDRARS